MAQTAPSHSTGLACSGSPATGDADVTTEDCQGLAGFARGESFHISCLSPFPKDLVLPTVTRDWRPAGPLVCPTVTILKFLHQDSVCAYARLYPLENLGYMKINSALIARPKPPQASYSSPPSLTSFSTLINT